jgi:hypothetical protein
MACAGTGSGSRPYLRWLPVALCGLLAWSALNFRFAPSLHKEDYRSAAAYVRPLAEQGQSIWWLAGGYVANYYGLGTAYYEPAMGKAFVAFLSRTDIHTLPLPDVIVLNRPDVHDAGGTVQKIIADNHFQVAVRYQGFVIWTNAAK